MLPSDYLRRGWCQGAMARDLDGYPTSPCVDGACEWCVEGAAIAAMWDSRNAINEFMRRLSARVAPGFAGIPHWNDEPGRKREEVIAMAEQVEREMRLRATE